MSKERELLERVMYRIPSTTISEHDLDLVDDIKELLAQPEHFGNITDMVELKEHNKILTAELQTAKASVVEMMRLVGTDDAGLRDHFAGLAMQAFLSTDGGFDLDPVIVAEAAYEQAEAMLEQRADREAMLLYRSEKYQLSNV
jgi:hypothetical protein